MTDIKMFQYGERLITYKFRYPENLHFINLPRIVAQSNWKKRLMVLNEAIHSSCILHMLKLKSLFLSDSCYRSKYYRRTDFCDVRIDVSLFYMLDIELVLLILTVTVKF